MLGRSCAFVAFSNLAQHPWRLRVAVLGTAVPILFLFVQMAFLAATRYEVTRLYSNFKFDLAFVPVTYQYLYSGGSFDRIRLMQAKAVAGVADTYSLNIDSASWTDETSHKRSSVLLLGYDDAPDFILDAGLRQGLSALRGNRSLLVDEFSSADLGSLAVGRSVKLNGQPVDIVGHFRLGLFFYADGSVAVRNTAFPALTGRDARECSVGLLSLQPGASLVAVQAELERALPQDIRVLTREQLIHEEQAFFISTKPIGIMLKSSMLIAYLVGAAILWQVLSTEVRNRTAEFATFKAIGFGPSFVFGVGLVQMLVLALCAFGLAILGGWGLLVMVERATHLPTMVTVPLVASVLLLVLAMCLFAAIAVAVRIARADPVDLYAA